MRRGYSAGLCQVQGCSGMRQEHGGLAWRVECSLVGHPMIAIPIPFAAQADAQAAAAWCAARLPTPEITTLDDFCRAWDSIGGSMQATADQLVAECCRW